MLSERANGAGAPAALSSRVRVGGTAVGSFDAFRYGPHEWTERQIRANEAYANVIGVVLLRLVVTSQHPTERGARPRTPPPGRPGSTVNNPNPER